jgi:hypothetical protein
MFLRTNGVELRRENVMPEISIDSRSVMRRLFPEDKGQAL